MLKLTPGQHIHLIGIGGAGLSAIARILLQRGFTISGSDLNQSAVTAALAADGVRFFHGHSGAYVAGADLVLASSAVPAGHVEMVAARESGIPIYKRQEFMAPLLKGKDTIAIAGTHGKTTTTSMIVHILRQAGQDPSYIVGGAMGNTGTNAGVGAGSMFVIEADEYDNMFLGLRPDIAVVTNIEHDHPDFFLSPAQLQRAFAQFVDLLPSTGTLVASSDDAGAALLAANRRQRRLPVINYGMIDSGASWRASDLAFGERETVAMVAHNGKFCGQLRLQVPGAHNVSNALAALAVADACGVPFEQSSAALEGFCNTSRRFEIRGIRDEVVVVDDYAHHPTEIMVNIEAARARYPRHAIWAVWQPHTYSRVRQFLPEFLSAFDAADHVLITPIYAARETPVAGISGQMLADRMADHPSARYVPTFDDAAGTLRKDISPPALVLICSAGDANRIADLYLESAENPR